MTIVPINLGVQSRKDRHSDNSRLVNCFAESAGEGGKVQYPIYADYGLKRFLALPYGASIRGAISVRDDSLDAEFLYVVSGNNLFKVAKDGSHILLPISIAEGRLTMASNGKLPFPEIAICVDGIAYLVQTDLVDDNDTYQLISDVDLPASNSVEEVGGYFLFTNNQGQFYLSGRNDGLNYDAIDFDAADVSPDGILVSKRLSEGRVLIFGPKSIESWRHTGDADFPLERDIGSTIQYGTYSPDSIAKYQEYLGFVSSDGVVRLLTSGGSRIISTTSVQDDISRVELKSIKGTFYSIEGQKYYCISSNKWTWKYSLSTGLWHENKSYNQDRWRGGISVEFDGKTLIGDYRDSRLYELSSDYHQEDDEPLILELTTPDQQAFPSRYRCNALYLDIQTATGIQSEDPHNYEPKAMVQYSDDSGRSWSNEKSVEIGRIGETKKRVRLRRLGLCKTGARSWRISVAANVAKGIYQASADITQLGT